MLPLQFLAAWLGVWFARALQQQVDYLWAENQIFKEKLGERKLDLTNAERRRLAVLGKELGRKLLAKSERVCREICSFHKNRVSGAHGATGRVAPAMGDLGVHEALLLGFTMHLLAVLATQRGHEFFGPLTEIEAGGTAPACDLGLAGLKPSNP
jgi:hypothetical protein